MSHEQLRGRHALPSRQRTGDGWTAGQIATTATAPAPPTYTKTAAVAAQLEDLMVQPHASVSENAAQPGLTEQQRCNWRCAAAVQPCGLALPALQQHAWQQLRPASPAQEGAELD